MKRMMIALLLLLGLLAGCHLFYHQLAQTTTQLGTQLDALHAQYLSQQPPESTDIDPIYAQWEQSKRWMGLVLAHEALEEIEHEFVRLRETMALENDMESRVLLRSLSALVNHLAVKEQVTWENIF